MNIQHAIKNLMQGQSLTQAEMQTQMAIIMGGEATPSQISGFLVALAIKGETVDEIVGAARIMKSLAAAVKIAAPKIIDSVGTGGDSAKLFNVSTACAFVAAAAGGIVAKHGNRAASGNCGSADVLEAAGVNINIKPAQVADCIAHCGVGFMFAPSHHSAMRHAINTRKEIAVRTIFNLLGPLTNPANASHQLTGVFAREWVEPMAQVLGRMGSKHAVVVHSNEGMDEISIAEDTAMAEFHDGQFKAIRMLRPEDYGIARQTIAPLIVADSAQSLRLLQSALAGEKGPAYDMVALNAGATIYAGDMAANLQEGVELARAVLDSGKALEKLTALARFSTALGLADKAAYQRL